MKNGNRRNLIKIQMSRATFISDDKFVKLKTRFQRIKAVQVSCPTAFARDSLMNIALAQEQ